MIDTFAIFVPSADVRLPYIAAEIADLFTESKKKQRCFPGRKKTDSSKKAPTKPRAVHLRIAKSLDAREQTSYMMSDAVRTAAI